MSQNPKISTNVSEIRRNDNHKNFSMLKNGLFCAKWLRILIFGTKCKYACDELRRNDRNISENKRY